jgi:hypothetical protein
MTVSMNRVVLGCVCGVGALIAAACGEGGRNPTGPSASPLVSQPSVTAAGDGAMVSTGAATVSDHERPFTGSLALAVDQEPVFDFPTLSLHFAVTGEATHLGRFTGVLQLDIDISHEEEGTETSKGVIVLTAADGDTVTGTVVGAATVAGEDKHIVETVSITGGTGRFGRATGTFVITRESALPGSFEGTISY